MNSELIVKVLIVVTVSTLFANAHKLYQYQNGWNLNAILAVVLGIFYLVGFVLDILDPNKTKQGGGS